MPVSTQKQEYNENLPLWQLVRDCVSGQKAIKEKTTLYLPKPIGRDEEAYKRYLARAHFAMFAARTAEGLYGQVFSKEPDKQGELPQVLENFLENVDNTGTSIDQFASDLVWDSMQAPWGGILVDHSPVPEGMTQAEKERAKLTSFLRWYTAESVINWRYDTINEQQTLALVVLKEDYETVGEDKFNPVQKTRYRVLELVDGVYIQEIWEKVDSTQSGKDEYMTTAVFVPELDGKHLDFIPFFTCPAKEPEKSMLLPIAYLNIGHYQLTADHTNLLHFTATPTGYGVNVRPAINQKTGEPIPMEMGGEVFHYIEGIDGKEARVGYLEPSGQGGGQLLSAIEAIEKNMEVMGADIIKPQKKGVETADAAKIHKAGENAVLGSFSLNMSEKLTQAIRLGARWRGVPENITENFTYSLNQNYEGDLSNIDSTNLALRERDNGVMSLWRYLTETKEMSDEEAEAEIKRIREEEAGKFMPIEEEPVGNTNQLEGE